MQFGAGGGVEIVNDVKNLRAARSLALLNGAVNTLLNITQGIRAAKMQDVRVVLGPAFVEQLLIAPATFVNLMNGPKRSLAMVMHVGIITGHNFESQLLGSLA